MYDEQILLINIKEKQVITFSVKYHGCQESNIVPRSSLWWSFIVYIFIIKHNNNNICNVYYIFLRQKLNSMQHTVHN